MATTSSCVTRLKGLEIYSLYAHLREVRRGLKVGQAVKAGEEVAVMGRTANTRESISKDRAHLHFELNLLVNDRFAGWYKKTFPGPAQRSRRMERAEPARPLTRGRSSWGSTTQGAKFSLLGFLQGQTELCRVLVRKTYFPWLKRYAPLVRPNPRAEKEGIAGYEIALNFNGVPFELIPRAARRSKARPRFQLLSVNEAEYHKNPGRRLVTKKGSRWELTSHGLNLLELLTY